MTAEVIAIRSRWDALNYGDAWRRYAWRMEALYELACIRASMSEALLQDAEAELARLKGEASGRSG